MARDLDGRLSKENIQMANRHVKRMLNITYHQGNANQDHKEISPHTSQNDHHQKIYKQ